MTELEQYALLKELEKSAEWMKSSAPRFNVKEYQSLEEQIRDLDKDSGDYYEVCIEIHFINGRYITIRNRAFETLVHGFYMGDEIDIEAHSAERVLHFFEVMATLKEKASFYAEHPLVDDASRKVLIPVVGVQYKDPETGFTEVQIPASSICYVSTYIKKIKWQERWAALSRDKKDKFISTFDKKCFESHQEK